MKITDTIEKVVKQKVTKYYCDSCGELITTLEETSDDIWERANTTTISLNSIGDNGLYISRLICLKCKERIKNKIELLLINEHLYDGSDPTNLTPCYENELKNDMENM